jgi:hypothetical protein
MQVLFSDTHNQEEKAMSIFSITRRTVKHRSKTAWQHATFKQNSPILNCAIGIIGYRFFSNMLGKQPFIPHRA